MLAQRLRVLPSVLVAVFAASPARAGDLPALVPQATLTADDGVPSDGFGTAVALSADTLVVGAPRAVGTAADGGSSPHTGAAYVFVKTGATWAFQAKLLAQDGADGDALGASVSLSGDTVLAGASTASYAFVRSGGIWAEQAKLAHGASVSLSGDTALVGTGVGAIVYERMGALWGLPASFVPVSDAQLSSTVVPADAGVQLTGTAVTIAGNTAVVGGHVATIDSINPWIGVAQIYERSGTTWTADTVVSDGDEFAGFGASAALSGDTLIVGSLGNEANSNDGKAHIFVRGDAGWSRQGVLTPPRSIAMTFGGAVAISGDTAVVGQSEDSLSFVYERDAGSWVPSAQASPPDGGVVFCGTSVALSGESLAVGCPSYASASGTAYVYELSGADPTDGGASTGSGATTGGAPSEGCSCDAAGAARGIGSAWLGMVAAGAIALRRRRPARAPWTRWA